MYLRTTSQLANTIQQLEYNDFFDARAYLKPGLTEQDIVHLREVFNAFDFDEDGFLNPLDIRSALTKHGYQAKKDTAHHLVGEYDNSMHGMLDFNDFVAMCSKNHNQEMSHKSEIRSIFRKYAKNNQAYFDVTDLKRVSKELGEDVDDETLEEMIKSMDSNADGMVTFEDFYAAMTKHIK